MSCSDVVRHHPPGSCRPPPLKLPTGGADAPASPPPPCSFSVPPVSPSQQNKIVVYSKMQESLEVTLPNKQEEDEKDQPTEMEYLNSRCVLFTYFQGDIGSVVDEHFSRALNQASSFSPEAAISKSKTGLNSLWRENSTIASQRSGFPASFWTSSYQTPPSPCLSGVHHDFPVPAPGTFSTADPNSWPGHALHQTAPPPPPGMSESWHYPLASQVSSSYGHMHDVYMHHHHPHAHVHHHPTSHLDTCYRPLLMPSVCAGKIPPPQCDAGKTDPSVVTSATSAWAGAFHGTVDIVPTFGFDTEIKAYHYSCKQLRQSDEAAWMSSKIFQSHRKRNPVSMTQLIENLTWTTENLHRQSTASSIRTKVKRHHGSDLSMAPVLRPLLPCEGDSPSFFMVAPNIEPLEGHFYMTRY